MELFENGGFFSLVYSSMANSGLELYLSDHPASWAREENVVFHAKLNSGC